MEMLANRKDPAFVQQAYDKQKLPNWAITMAIPAIAFILMSSGLQPIAKQILGGLGTMLDDWFGAGAKCELAVNADLLSELAEDRLKLWEAATKADFLTITEKRDMLGFETGTEALTRGRCTTAGSWRG